MMVRRRIRVAKCLANGAQPSRAAGPHARRRWLRSSRGHCWNHGQPLGAWLRLRRSVSIHRNGRRRNSPGCEAASRSAASPSPIPMRAPAPRRTWRLIKPIGLSANFSPREVDQGQLAKRGNGQHSYRRENNQLIELKRNSLDGVNHPAWGARHSLPVGVFCSVERCPLRLRVHVKYVAPAPAR
jgi:hypothetical protein